MYDENLKALQEKAARRRQLEAQIKELTEQRRELGELVRQLDEQRLKEEQDAEKLIEKDEQALGKSRLYKFFRETVLRSNHQIVKALDEVMDATLKADAAGDELLKVHQDLKRVTEEYQNLEKAEANYRKALNDKREALKASDTPVGQELLELEEQLSALDILHREIEQAIIAGHETLAAANATCDRLEHADGLAIWDLVGGGVLVDMIKHETLDQAQEQVQQLQSCLRRFRTELADVRMNADLQVNLEGFTRFADYFFDGLFMDWAVSNKIKRSKEEILRVIRQLEDAIASLNEMQDKTDISIRACQADIEKLVLETQV